MLLQIFLLQNKLCRQKQSHQIICGLQKAFSFSSLFRSTLISSCCCGREELKLFELAAAVLADVSVERKKRSADTVLQRSTPIPKRVHKATATVLWPKKRLCRDTRIHVARIIQLWHGKKHHRPDWIVKTFYSRLHALSRPQK